MGDSERELEKDEGKEQDPSIKENENSRFDTSSSDSDFEFEITCKVCNKTFSGIKPLRQHEKGRKHRQRVLKKEMEKNILKKFEENPADCKEEDVSQAIFAVCKTCKKEFMGPESFEQHINSSSHRKKIAASKLLKEIKDEDGNFNVEKLKQRLKKEKSQMSPLVVGTSSDHSSRSGVSEHGGIDGASGYSGPPISSDDSSADERIAETQEFECLDCKKVFTGVNSWYQHVVSKVHEKTLKQKELFDKLRIAGTSLPNESSTDRYLVQEEDDVICCRLCNVAFSGPESAVSHLKSRKHKKNLELKKLKKSMKDNNEETKNSSKTNKKVYITSPTESSSDLKNKEYKREDTGSKTDHHTDKDSIVEFPYSHDKYKSISEIKSISTVEKVTDSEPSNLTGPSSEKERETDQPVENYEKLQNQLASSPDSVDSSEKTMKQDKNNLQSFKETRI